MIESIDQLGRVLRFAERPQRIVSLVPSISELLVDLGLRQNIIGCTKFCVHPADLRSAVTTIGGTKNIKAAVIKSLQPDLIVASKEENVREQVEALADCCPVWVSDVRDIATADELNRRLGALFGVPERAEAINEANARGLDRHVIGAPATAVYLIWQNPFMSVGGDTYIHAVLERLGYKNLTGEAKRYPAITLSQLEHLQPDCLLLSSEPFPFNEQHVDELQGQLPGVDVRLVNGEYYSWYGSRLGKLATEGDGLTTDPGVVQNS